MDDTMKPYKEKERFRKATHDLASKVKILHSVQEVVLCGSIAGDDPYPQDIDLAVVLSDLTELSQLARFCRQISSTTHAWKVFVFDTNRKYLGRICHKRECSGQSYCDAPDCGRTPHLHNIRGFRFDPAQFLSPALQVLWNRNEDSFLLSWRKELNLKAPWVKTYETVRLKCRVCGDRFIFEAAEQKYFEKRGWEDPRRCPTCREEKWLHDVGIDPESEWED